MDRTIQITVLNKIAVKTCDTVYVCGNSDFSVHFTFDDEWAEHYSKTARFIANDGSFVDVPFSGDACPVPILRNTYGFNVGVYAGNLSTTTPAYCPAKKSILCKNGQPKDPEPDVYATIMEKLNDGSLKGEPGPQGEKGEKGEPGTTGPQGEKGEKGDKGEPGEKGDKGDKGERGEQGIQGEKGDKGDIGPHGPQGETGPRGPEGPQGTAGATGPQGKPGDNNIFIANIVLDDDGHIILDCTQQDIKDAAEAGKIPILRMFGGETYLYLGEDPNEEKGGEWCPLFASPVHKDASGKIALSTIFVNRDNTLTWFVQSPISGRTINYLTIEKDGERINFNGSEQKTVKIEDAVFPINVVDLVADKTQKDVITAVSGGKIPILRINNKTFVHMGSKLVPDGSEEVCPYFAAPIYIEEDGQFSMDFAYLKSGKKIYCGSFMPFKTPTDSPLTIKTPNGEIKFDGSLPQTVDLTELGSGGGTGTGSGLPTTSAPYQMLVTDPDGNVTWEERTHYYHAVRKDILPEYAYKADDAVEVFGFGELAIKTPFIIESGASYDVIYNGVTYKCIASTIEGMGVLGNAKVADPSLPGNDEPFLIGSFNGVDMTGAGCYGLIMPIDGAFNGTLSIQQSKDEHKRLPYKYLPEIMYGEADEETVFLSETMLTFSDGMAWLPYDFEKPLTIGDTVVVTFNGKDYECEVFDASKSESISGLSIALGNSKALGGRDMPEVPFTISVTTPDSDLASMGKILIGTQDSSLTSTTISVKIPKGFRKRVHMKYLDKRLMPVANLVSEDYYALMHGEARVENPKYVCDMDKLEFRDMLKDGRFGGMHVYYTESTTSKGFCAIINKYEISRDANDILQATFYADGLHVNYYGSTGGFNVQKHTT